MNLADLAARAGFDSRRLPVFQQTLVTECGLACLGMVASYHGHDVDLPALRRRYPPSVKGVSLARLIQIAEQLGFQARPLKLELDGLRHLQTPCILHWDLGHYVVLKRVSSRGAEIHDPARGAVRLSLSEVSRSFTGIALELEPGTDFQPLVERRPISLRALTGRLDGLLQSISLVLLLALALEAFTLVLPLALQLVVDHVLVTADSDLLTLLGVGFLAIVAMQALTTALRGWVIASISASINSQWVGNLFGHLLRLPTAYFEGRHIGAIMSRFSSLTTIQQTLTSSFVDALLNGLTVILVLAVLAAYSPALTLLVLGSFLAYLGLRLLAYRRLRRLNEEQLVFASLQHTRIIETVRGMQTVKLANKQAERHSRVANSTIELTNRQAQAQRLGAGFSALNTLLFGSQRIALLWLGGLLVLGGEWTVGVLVVFVAYAEMFSTRGAALIDRLVEFGLLGVHAERIADIALEPPEGHQQSSYVGPTPQPSLCVENLGFRYAEDEPWVIRHLNFSIRAGEAVAIVGPSGCGKTTLAKLLLGLLEPTEGSIRIGGIDIRRYGLAAYREMVGAVMQNDELFAGSVADNISFFDPAGNLDAIVAASRAACIHDEIVAMPMGYETQIGDMGSALSGGQKQRVLLARALYRQPALLLLDEATSHLDVDRERWINRQVSELQITRIIIAHRPDTIASADRVIALRPADAAAGSRHLETVASLAETAGR